MQFDPPLISGRLVARYKRFFADVELDDGTHITAHCANTGAMTGVAEPGARVWLSDSGNPKRKLRHSWEMIEARPGHLVGIHTNRANNLVEEALTQGKIAELTGYANIRREVAYGQTDAKTGRKTSRIDFLLEAENAPPAYLEVKSVTLSRNDGLAEFPDTKTARGVKHLQELAAQAKNGDRAVMLFLVQRDDCRKFAIARDLDPDYAQRFVEARANGVETICYSCKMSPEEISVQRTLDIIV